MALAIVPCERNLLAPQKPPADLTSFPLAHPAPNSEPDDLTALAADLAADEALNPVEAISQALALQHEIMAFAVLWDVDAELAGTPKTIP